MDFVWMGPASNPNYTGQGYYTNERGNTVGAWSSSTLIVDRRRSRHTIFNICNATRAQPVPRRPVGTMLPSGTARRIDWDTPRDSRRASDPRKIPEPYRRWALEGGFLAEFPHATGELSGRFGPGSPREYASP
jgi:hypothetical protein